MNFRVLGPLEAKGSKGQVRIRSARQRALLGLLLVRANQLVPRDLLIDELWSNNPPATASHTVEAYVSRLRRAFGMAGNGSAIESHPGGYRLLVEEDELDVLRFQRLLEEAHSKLHGGALEEAERSLTAALGLWRGPALADLAETSILETEAQRLEELRLAGIEARLEVALRLGRDAELVGELQSLVAAHPQHERLRAELMLALYRSGRQADALATYREGRGQLVDELGIEPSRELQDLEAAILRHDQALDSPPGVAKSSAAPGLDRPLGPAHSPAAVAKRRGLVTVMLCEAVDAKIRDEQPDPEVLTVALDTFFVRVRATVESYGGTVDGTVGRAVMAVFGVPARQEDDALRACRAAGAIRASPAHLGLQARIGVSSGEALADDSAQFATGNAVDSAARLQQAAGPGEVLISDTTLELTDGSVEVQAVGPLATAGLAPVLAYRLLSTSDDPRAPTLTEAATATTAVRGPVRSLAK